MVMPDGNLSLLSALPFDGDDECRWETFSFLPFHVSESNQELEAQDVCSVTYTGRKRNRGASCKSPPLVQ